MSSPRERVAQVCDEALGRLDPGPARDKVVEVKNRLDEPLRVAVAGRVKAGKSTLVNALLERRIAPTATGECTRVVTWFRYGVTERVELRLDDGRVKPVSITEDGRIPESLGEPPAAIESINVYLSNALLRDLTIIDTPGLASGNDEYSAETAALLARNSHTAVSQADALIYIVTQDVKADDRGVLEDFRGQFGGARASVANTVGVLNKADKIGSGQEDALDKAQQVADRFAEALDSVVSEVIPAVGLLAQTAATDFGNVDAHHVAKLADLGPEARKRMLVAVDRFKAFESDVPRPQRERLLDLLDRFGLRRCFALVDAGARGAPALIEELRAVSGVDRLRGLIDETFRRNADALKAEVGLADLERVAYSPVDSGNADGLAWLKSSLDDLRHDADMHRLNELWAIQQTSSGAVELAPELQADLRRLVTGDDPAAKLGLPPEATPSELQSAAAAGAARWARFANQGMISLAESQIARVADRSYTHLWSRAAPQEAGVR